jgi:predicted nucleic acid-binding Zn finger protein
MTTNNQPKEKILKLLSLPLYFLTEGKQGTSMTLAMQSNNLIFIFLGESTTFLLSRSYRTCTNLMVSSTDNI